jgi:hypothetical protein
MFQPRRRNQKGLVLIAVDHLLDSYPVPSSNKKRSGDTRVTTSLMIAFCDVIARDCRGSARKIGWARGVTQLETCVTDAVSASGPMMKWLIGLVALVCSFVLAAPAFADGPSMPLGQPGEQIRLLTPPAMPAPLMIVERAIPAGLETPADSSAAPLRADRASYALPPGAAISVQSPATAVQEAAYSPSAPFEGAAPSGPQMRGQARASFDATNGYSVTVNLCSIDAQNQPVPNSVLSLTIRSASGHVLFGANVTTDEYGCYTGTTALGSRVAELPVQLSAVDDKGVTTDFPISPPR